MRPFTADKLAATLATQHGVVATRQIIDACCDHELATREVAGGRWQAPVRGVYFAFAGAPTLLQRAWCAQLLGGEEAVISGPVACQLMGVPDSPGTTAVVLVPDVCHRSGTADYVVRRTGRLPLWTDVGGVRVAAAARAVVDASRTGDLRGVRAVVCGALNAKHTSYDELRSERAAQRRAGLAMLGRALDDWADGARSAPEAEVADALREEVRRGNMPPFLLNPKLFLGPVLLGSADVYVPGCALGSETDSLRHHGSKDDLDATLQRHAVFEDAGIRLEHVTPTRFRRSPATWAWRFAATAADRSALGDPPGLRIEPVGPLQPVPGRRRR